MRATRDTLPELTTYKDTGCRVHNSCFTCPLEQCVFDSGVRFTTIRSISRVEDIIQLRTQGLKVREIASTLGVGNRTIFRALASVRQDNT